MSIHHHPSDSWLIRYAAGRLPDSFRRVIESHVTVCQRCADAVDDATVMSAVACNSIAPARLNFDVDAFIGDLDEDDVAGPEQLKREQAPSVDLVSLIDQFVEVGGLESLRWRPAGRGVSFVRLRNGFDEGRLWLLRAAPGTVLPQHAHRGDELTLVLKGAYFNRNQLFAAGDIEEADEFVEHKPMVTDDEECICLAATDAPLKFRGWLPRMSQAVTRL